MALAIMAVASIISAGVSIKNAQDQRDATEEQNEVISAQEKINDINSKRSDAKQARIARARLLQGGEATGTQGSSGEAGALSSLQTQLGANIANRQGQANTANAITNIGEDLADKQMTSAYIDTGASIFNAYGSYKYQSTK